METIILFATIVTATATVVIAVATVAYVKVTKKLWAATLETARLTEKLAEESRDVFLLQLVAMLVQERKMHLERHGMKPADPSFGWPSIGNLWDLMRELFPKQWQVIELKLYRKRPEAQE